jgi:DNA-binding beta-propeller fold protein YncE
MGNPDIEMKTSLIIICCTALLAGGAALSGCGGDSTTAPRSAAPFTDVSENVFVVLEEDGLSLVSDADSVLVFDVAAGAPTIARNTILVGTEGGGYIRRVESTRTEGQRLFVRAAPAYLTDAVICGQVDTSLTLGFGSAALEVAVPADAAGRAAIEAARGVSASRNGLDLSGITLYSAADAAGSVLTVTITQGRIEFDPALDLLVRIAPGALSELRAIAEGELRLTCDATVEATGPLQDAIDFAMPIAAVRRTVVQHIGPVPVVEAVTLGFMAEFSVSSGFAGQSELSIETTAPLRCGVRYDRRAWSSVFNASSGFEAHSFTYASPGQAEIRLTLAPFVEVDFYGLPGVRMQFGPSFGLSERDVGFPVLEWELWADISGSMAFRRGALGARAAAYDGREHCCRVTLDSGPFRTDSYVFIREWGNGGAAGDEYLSYPSGIALDGGGNVYVTDNWDNCVRKFTSTGEFLLRWGETGSGDAQFNSPEKIAVDEDGFIYVVDGGNNRIQKFTANGGFISKWGSEGTGDGQLKSPVGIAAAGGVVYVTDNQNNRVEMFSTSGGFLGTWGTYGGGPGQFDGPSGAAVVPDGGDVLIADCRNNRIQRFTPNGLYLASWGGYGNADGQFNCPIDVTVAPQGAIFAADLGNDRFIRFAPDGSFSTKLGTPGTGPGQFDHPEAIAVDANGYVYVVDSRNRRIQQFAPRPR